MEKISINMTDSFGMPIGVFPMLVHGSTECAGQSCSIHNPTPQPLSAAPLLWRQDRGTIERLCPHGIGHPDVDDIIKRKNAGLELYAIHSCDGCC